MSPVPYNATLFQPCLRPLTIRGYGKTCIGCCCKCCPFIPLYCIVIPMIKCPHCFVHKGRCFVAKKDLASVRELLQRKRLPGITYSIAGGLDVFRSWSLPKQRSIQASHDRRSIKDVLPHKA